MLRENPTIQNDHEKVKDQVDRTQTQSSLTIGPIRKKKLGKITKGTDRHRGK